MIKNKGMIIVFFALIAGITTVSAFSQTFAPFPTKYYGDDLSKYIPGFSPEMCTGGSDFLVQVDPVQGCSPRVVRSDLLEENSVPIFCPLQAIKINPLLDVPEIKSIVLVGGREASKEIAGLSFYPARAALKSNTELVGSPTISNIGYLVAILQKQPIEKNMSDWVVANVTAHIEYDALKTYGIGYKQIVSTQLSDEALWQSSYKQYGFWNGKGYVRVSDIEEENARVDVYSDVNNKIASYVLKQGNSERGYLPGFYCSAGYDVRLDSIRLPGTRAKLSIDSDIAVVTEGGSILDGKCSVSSIKEDAFGGGEVKLSCPDKTHYLRINLPSALLAATEKNKDVTESDYAKYEIGKGIKVDEKDVYIYLVYVGESPDKKDYVVVVRKSGGGEISNAELQAISGVIDKSTRKKVAVGRLLLDIWNKVPLPWRGKEADEKDFKDSVGVVQKANNFQGLKDALEKKSGEGFIRKILNDNSAEVKVIEKGSSDKNELGDYRVYFKGFEGFEEDDEEGNAAITHFYEKAIKEYEETTTTFPQEKNALGDFYGAISLQKSAELAKRIGNTKDSRKLLEEIVEKYPNTPQAEKAGEELARSKNFDISKASVEVKIRGKSHYITLEEIETASAEDLGAELIVDNRQPVTYGIGDIVEGVKKEGKIIVDSVDKEEVTFSYEYKSTTKESFFQNYKIRRGNSGKIGDVTIFVNSIKMNREAHVTVSPVIRGGSTDANFTFKIAIEKRAIKLSPEKTKELINTLNTSIARWEKTVTDLGNLVKTWKGACFVGAITLQVKAFLNNLGGGSIARSEVMKRYRNICAGRFGPGKEFKSPSACYQHYNTEITNDIKQITQRTRDANSLIENCKKQAGGKVDSDSLFNACVESAGFNGIELSSRKSTDFKFDSDSVNELKEKYSGDPKKKFQIEGEKSPLTADEFLKKVEDEESLAKVEKRPSSYQGKKIEVYEEINQKLGSKDYKDLNKKGIVTYNDLKDIARDKSLLEDCKKGLLSQEYCGQFKSAIYNKIETYKKGLEEAGIKPDEITFKQNNKGFAVPQVLPGLLKTDIKKRRVYTATEDLKSSDDTATIIVKKGEQYMYDSIGNTVALFVLTKSGNKYNIQTDKIYKVENNIVTSKKFKVSEELTEDKRTELQSIAIEGEEPGVCKGNKFLDTEKKVKYFETEPYKGLPAIVPFDKEGWYAAVPPYRVIGTQSSSAYDQSALLRNFWICNAGQNGRVEFYNSPSGDDAECCTKIVEGTPAGGWVIDGLSETESRVMVANAIKAVDSAANQYGQKQIQGIGNVGTLIADIQPVIPSAECEEFMDPSDCNLMFNLCDPVLCPTSRCNLGGNFYVDDVVQSGVIGSALLCLPNFGPPQEGGVLVPVCLTGIHAGLDNLVTILKASRDCLQESLNTGRNVGICDQIKSVYLCEFFWRQFTPLIKAGIPAIFNALTHKNAGGGEYLVFNDAWDKSAKSVQYFTNSYGLNAFKAFRARTTSEIGSDVCRAFISQRYPSSTFLDQLTEPESPVQFSAWFEEIPLTTATLPARSQYKIYYHIYSGKDEGTNYYVYLKRTPGTSLYQQTEQVFVDSGFVPRGEFVDKAPDIIASSGLQKLCVVINMKEECGFGKVSTSFAINRLTDMYLAEQATKEVKNEEECVGGTPGITPAILSGNIQAGVTESLQPELMQKGIVRICSGSNPSTSTEPSRWKPVGYCDDEKRIRCWLDEKSVKENIKSKDLQKQTLEEAEQNLVQDIEGLGLMGDEESRAKLSELEGKSKGLEESITKVIQTLGVDNTNLADEIEKVIAQVKSGFEEVIEKSAFNPYKARAKYGLASLYDLVVEKLKKIVEEKEKKKITQIDLDLDIQDAGVIIIKSNEQKVLRYGGKNSLFVISDKIEKKWNNYYSYFLIDGIQKGKIFKKGGNQEFYLIGANTYQKDISVTLQEISADSSTWLIKRIGEGKEIGSPTLQETEIVAREKSGVYGAKIYFPKMSKERILQTSIFKLWGYSTTKNIFGGGFEEKDVDVIVEDDKTTAFIGKFTSIGFIDKCEDVNGGGFYFFVPTRKEKCYAIDYIPKRIGKEGDMEVYKAEPIKCHIQKSAFHDNCAECPAVSDCSIYNYEEECKEDRCNSKYKCSWNKGTGKCFNFETKGISVVDGKKNLNEPSSQSDEQVSIEKEAEQKYNPDLEG